MAKIIDLEDKKIRKKYTTERIKNRFVREVSGKLFVIFSRHSNNSEKIAKTLNALKSIGAKVIVEKGIRYTEVFFWIGENDNSI